MYYKLQHIAFYFVVPVARFLIATFLVLNFLFPLFEAWAGGLLAQFAQQAADELRGYVVTYLPEWMQ